MQTKFSEDIVAISDLKANPGKIVKQVSKAHRPVLLTSRGRGVAIVQALSDYESSEDERSYMRAVVKGIVDLEQGREVSLEDVKKPLNLI